VGPQGRADHPVVLVDDFEEFSHVHLKTVKDAQA